MKEFDGNLRERNILAKANTVEIYRQPKIQQDSTSIDIKLDGKFVKV